MHYIRFVVSVLLMFGVSGLPVWGISFAEVDKQVERKVGQAKGNAKATRPAAKQNSAGLAARRQRITAALDKVRVKQDDPNAQNHIITLSKFQQEEDSFATQAENLASIQAGLQTQIHNILKPYLKATATNNIYSLGQERPNYSLETKGIPFIYLTDASGHGTQSIVREVQEVIRSVRQANPNANILLATEFAVMSELDTPIQFAGKTNKTMNLTAPYDQLAPQAAQLGIDILALDDYVVWIWPDGMMGEKVGTKLLYIPYAQNQISDQAYDQLQHFLETSSLGIKLRNEQWAAYLNAVKSYYDIVIVYAGKGHIRSRHLTNWDVPRLMGTPSVFFHFYTNEHKAGETYASKEVEKFEQNGRLPNHIVYKKLNVSALKKIEQMLPANQKAKLQELRQKWKNAGLRGSTTTANFDVYLPDATQAAGK